MGKIHENKTVLTRKMDTKILQIHKFIFDQTKDEFIDFFKNEKIGKVKLGVIYDFVIKNKEFTFETDIPKIGTKTKEKLFNLNFERSESPEKKIDVLDIIIRAFVGKSELTLKEIYKKISDIVGGSNINLKTLKPYKTKDGSEIEYNKAKRLQEGFIRTFLEEHSADSRQHWVKENIVKRDGFKSNLFSNNNLKLRNEHIHWKMLSAETNSILKKFPVKRNGTWKLCPSTSKPTDLEFEQMEEELRIHVSTRSKENNVLKEKVILSQKIISTGIKK